MRDHGQRPLMAVVTEDGGGGGPLERLEAEEMLADAAFMRCRAFRLPSHSEYRQQRLDAAADLELAAQLLWPAARALVLAGHSEAG